MLVRKDDLFPTQHRATLGAAQRELEQLQARMAQIDSDRTMIQERVQTLGNMIAALLPLCQTEQEEEDAPKIGAICYHVLANFGRAATAPQIRDQVATMVDLSRYPNPLAVIHTVLGRMDGVQRFKGQDGKTYFQVMPVVYGAGL